MAIGGSGLYGPTLEKILKSSIGDLEAEDIIYVMLVTDSYTPDFDAHDFRADITNEIANGNGYTTGGMLGTGTELTVGAPATKQMKYDMTTDPAWTTATITSAMAAILYQTTGSSATDQLIYLSDFVTAASSSNGTFTVQVAANGWFYFTYAA